MNTCKQSLIECIQKEDGRIKFWGGLARSAREYIENQRRNLAPGYMIREGEQWLDEAEVEVQRHEEWKLEYLYKLAEM